MDASYVAEQLKAIQVKIDKGGKTLPIQQAKKDFFLTVQRALEKTATLADIGLLDAINDSLQHDKWLSSKETFYHGKSSA